MQKCAVCVLLLAVPALGTEQSAKLADLYTYSTSVNAEGVWRADNLNEKTELAFDTVTRLECYKHGGRELVGSDAYCMQAAAAIVLGWPQIEVSYYPVLSWDKDKIIAADSSTDAFPVCSWTQITINLQDHSIMATDTRKVGKGHEGLNNFCKEMPLAQTYHLVDKMEELARRRLRATRADDKKPE